MRDQRVCLGHISVVPQKGWLPTLESGFGLSVEKLEHELAAHLSKIFDIPHLESIDSETRPELCIDVYLASYSLGWAFYCDSPSYFLPLFWRPKIQLSGKLYELNDGRSVGTYSVTERPTWREFFSMTVLNRNYHVEFTSEELKVLMERASVRLLTKMAADARKRKPWKIW